MLAREVKVVVAGEPRAGKKSLTHALLRLPQDDFEATAPTTIDEAEELFPIAAETTERKVNTLTVKITLGCVSGKEKLDSMRVDAYKGADVFVLCYSLTDLSTLDAAVKTWAPEMKKLAPKVPIVLVGTKSDAVNDQPPSHVSADKRASRKMVVVDEKEVALAVGKLKPASFSRVSVRTGDGLAETLAKALEAGSVHRMRVTAQETKAKARRGTMNFLGRMLAPSENQTRLGARLCDAVLAGDEATVTDLFSKKAPVNWSPPESGKTPLHLAAETGSGRLVNILLNNGAKIEAEDVAKSTPLHLACRAGKPDAVKALLTRGAKPNARNVLGSTPLHEAATSGSKECVELLKDAKANAKLRDGAGYTPQDRANMAGHPFLFAAPPTEAEVDAVAKSSS